MIPHRSLISNTRTHFKAAQPPPQRLYNWAHLMKHLLPTGGPEPSAVMHLCPLCSLEA